MKQLTITEAKRLGVDKPLKGLWWCDRGQCQRCPYLIPHDLRKCRANLSADIRSTIIRLASEAKTMNNLQTPNTAPRVDLIKYAYNEKGETEYCNVIPLCRDCRHLNEENGALFCTLHECTTHLNLTCLDGSFVEERGKDK